MIRYERVTFKPEGATKSTTVFLRVGRDSDVLLTGVEVNREGEEVSGTDKNGKHFDSRTHIISKDLVTKRVEYAMNNKYGLLVKKGMENKDL